LVTPRIGTGTPTTAMNILNAAREAGALRHTARRTYWQDPLVVRRNTKRWRLTHKEECNTSTAAKVARSITLRLRLAPADSALPPLASSAGPVTDNFGSGNPPAKDTR
jgi:hypothetical protein